MCIQSNNVPFRLVNTLANSVTRACRAHPHHTACQRTHERPRAGRAARARAAEEIGRENPLHSTRSRPGPARHGARHERLPGLVWALSFAELIIVVLANGTCQRTNASVKRTITTHTTRPAAAAARGGLGRGVHFIQLRPQWLWHPFQSWGRPGDRSGRLFCGHRRFLIWECMPAWSVDHSIGLSDRTGIVPW